MDINYFIQEYYYFLITFICILIIFSFLNYFNKQHHNEQYLDKQYLDNVILGTSFIFSLFTVYYLGNRHSGIGFDTFRYENLFTIYKNSTEFYVRKDPFFDFFTYSFSKYFEFRTFLYACAFIYIFSAYYGLKLIFKSKFYLPFLIFLISPYFFNMGINVMRNGIASSIFLIALGNYYEGKKLRTIIFLFCSILFHISMIVPVICFLIAKFLIKKTNLIFLLWLGSIVLGILKINIFLHLEFLLDFLGDRTDGYIDAEGERVFWGNFIIFGSIPVIFAVYNIMVLKYKNDFYTLLVNSYILIHIPYLILINTEFASRLGYLAEFMMPILLMFPLLVDPVIKIRYVYFKLSLIIFLIFMIKAYKILIL